MERIYISYDRDDAERARWLYNALADRLGAERLWMDKVLVPGERFPEQTEFALRGTSTMLVVMGPNWLTKAQQRGSTDPIVHEISVALRRGIRVVPVLVDGASMPRAADLPDEVKILAHRRPIEIKSWEGSSTPNIEQLLDALNPPPVFQQAERMEPVGPRRVRFPDVTVPISAAIGFVVGLGVAVGRAAGKVIDAVEGLATRTPAPAPPPVGATEPLADELKCSIFAPAHVHPGGCVLVQVFAHSPGDAQQVDKLATTFDSETVLRATRFLDHGVARGSQLAFQLTVPNAIVDETVPKLMWRGTPESVQFVVKIPENIGETNLVGTVLVSQNGVPFGDVKFLIRVVTAEEPVAASGGGPKQRWKRYRFAFISYASPDRAEVLKRVQMLQRVSIEFFHDLLSLEPGERWAKQLYKNIDKSDVFFLFWSTAAKNSEWVMKEVRYAIQRKAGDEFAHPEIVPVIIEGPPPVPPPPELQHLHFNDRLIYLIERVRN
jgi:hypothetical protein